MVLPPRALARAVAGAVAGTVTGTRAVTGLLAGLLAGILANGRVGRVWLGLADELGEKRGWDRARDVGESRVRAGSTRHDDQRGGKNYRREN